MTWSKLSDDFTDDCWTMSDAAYRLHTEGITWSNRKLLDCRIPKDDIRRMKRPEAIAELLADGWWREEGDEYVIVHHAKYQRLKTDVIKQQDANRANGARGGRPRKTAPTREVWQATGNPVANPVASRTAKPVDNRKGQDGTGPALEVSTTRGCHQGREGGAVSEPHDAAALAKNMAWLGISDCTCAHRWDKGGSMLHGVWMQHGWTRTTTEPECPHHGTVAEAARAARNKARGIW